MGWLSSLLGPSKEQPAARKPATERRRGKARPATERLAEQEARFLQKLERTDPQLWARIMSQRLNLGMQAEVKADKLEDFVKTLKLLREAGVLPKNPKELGEGKSDTVKDLAEAAMVALAMWQGQQAQRGGPVLPIIQQQAQPITPQPALAAPQAQPATTAATIPTEDATPQIAMQGGPMLALAAKYAKAELEKRNPDDAAAWLLSIDMPDVQALVRGLVQTPDDRLLVFLSSVAQQVPDFVSLLDWLKSRPEWLIQTVRALRRLSAGEQQTPEQQASASMGL